MDGFPRMLWIGRRHSADHIPVSALPPDGICNPIRHVLCNGRTLVCGHNVRVGITNPDPHHIRKGGTMDGFRRMLWIGRQHSADHIPVSALQLVTPPDWICNPVRNVLVRHDVAYVIVFGIVFFNQVLHKMGIFGTWQSSHGLHKTNSRRFD